MAVHLLTGPGGSGVSSLAAALAAGLTSAQRGASVTLATLAEDGTFARLAAAEAGPVLVDLARPKPWGDLDAAVAQAVQRAGADGAVTEEWRRLPGADVLAALIRLGSVAAAADHAVVDLGDLRSADAFLAAAGRIGWVLPRLLGLQATGARIAGVPGAGVVPGVLAEIEASAAVLRTARLHVVLPDDPGAAAKLRRSAPALLLAGPRPGLLLRGPGEPPDASADAHWLPFTPVRLVAWPVGADGALRSDAAAIVAGLPGIECWAAPGQEVSRSGSHLRWTLTLPWVRAAEVAVEQRGEDVVLSVHGRPYLVPTPAVVRRCRAVSAHLDGTRLVIEAVLRKGAWRTRG